LEGRASTRRDPHERGSSVTFWTDRISDIQIIRSPNSELGDVKWLTPHASQSDLGQRRAT